MALVTATQEKWYGDITISYPDDGSVTAVDAGADKLKIIDNTLINQQKISLDCNGFQIIAGYDYMGAEPIDRNTYDASKAYRKDREDTYVIIDDVVFGNAEGYGVIRKTSNVVESYALLYVFPATGRYAERIVAVYSEDIDPELELEEAAKLLLAIAEKPEARLILDTLFLEGETLNDTPKEAEEIDSEYFSITLKDGWYRDPMYADRYYGDVIKNFAGTVSIDLRNDNTDIFYGNTTRFVSMALNVRGNATPGEYMDLVLEGTGEYETLDNVFVNGIELLACKRDFVKEEFILITSIGPVFNKDLTGYVEIILSGCEIDAALPLLETLVLK
jgi:hypothetical protein